MDYSFSEDLLIIVTTCITNNNNDKMNNTRARHGLWIWLYLGFAYVARDCKSEINVSYKIERFRI